MPRDRVGGETEQVSPEQQPGGTLSAQGEPRVSLVIDERSGARIVPLRPGADVTVGRGEDCAVSIDDRGLSRQHVRFRLRADSTVEVTDLGSTNGTFIGGRRIESADLTPGDEVLFAGVTASLHVLRMEGDGARQLEGHERFRQRLESEVARAHYFRRSLALLMVRTLSSDGVPLRRWAPLVQEKLRPVDSVALYSDGALELLLPEASLADAVGLARLLTTAISPPLACGVALYPGAGTSAEELLDLARELSRSGTTEQPVRVASVEGARVLARATADTEAPVCESPTMRELYRTAARAARGSIPVLLLAETGAGKEVLARFLHDSSPRRNGPMVSVNCGAIPESLVESTLFGHEKGAFTGATGQHRGVFESAEGGTVFLDEIGELPLAAQAALLRVLEDKTITRVGSTKATPIDVRVITATHKQLPAMVSEGRFRQDLLYRLNAMTLVIPPLRERREEIPSLAARFLRRANEVNGTNLSGIAPEAMSLLLAHAWPGNVRELKNVVERAAVITELTEIGVEDLPLTLSESAAPPATAVASDPTPEVEDFRTKMDRLEAEILLDALRVCDWNQTKAAKRLSMPLRTLVHKIKLHNLKRLGFVAAPKDSRRLNRPDDT